MENENPTYYAIIPAEIRYDNDLKDKAKLLYGEITCLSNKNGYCFASNTYFANLYGVTKDTISRLITNLADKGYISREVLYRKGTKEIIGRFIKINHLSTKKSIPTDKKVDTPIDKKVKDNNTSINNTSNNSCCCNNNTNKDNLYMENALKTTTIEFYNQNIGLITPYQYEILQSFKEDGIQEELIVYAMKKACEINKRNISYIKAILNSYINKGITTLIEAQNEEEQFQKNKKPKEESIEERAKKLEQMMEEENELY